VEKKRMLTPSGIPKSSRYEALLAFNGRSGRPTQFQYSSDAPISRHDASITTSRRSRNLRKLSES